MATQGMFGNQYQQAVRDETALRRQQAQTGGLTGWAAITNAMSGIGSEIGYQGGQAFGGQTPAQVQETAFNSVMDSIPDFDLTNPEHLSEASSKYWQAGFYNEGMAMMNKSQSLIKDNLLVEKAELEIANLKDAPRKMTKLSDGFFWWTDTLDTEDPQRVKDDVVQPPKDKTAAMLKFDRNQLALDYRNSLKNEDDSALGSGTLEEKRVLLAKLDAAGYRDTDIFDDLQDTITSVANTERLVAKDVQTDEEQQEALSKAARLREMANIMPTGEGNNIVGGVFLRDKPDTGSDLKTRALQDEIGGILQSYDRRLSKREDSKITPAEAYPYYTRVFNLPEIYKGNTGSWGAFEFNPDALQSTLDAIFGVAEAAVSSDKLQLYIDNRLLIPGVSNVYNETTGRIEVYNPPE
tara:strand:- start:2918 stop:4141 length:1224 start_codon:yes stop_codon:yes gene_type:complete